MDHETMAMGLIVHAGNARSLAMEVIAVSKQGDFTAVEEKLKQAEEALHEAHLRQTESLQQSLENPDEPIGMLMTHAQDHMMNAITALDMAREFADLYRLIHSNIRKEILK